MEIILRSGDPDPLYGQIAAQIRSHIYTGRLGEGERLPSIRKLARDLQISVITTRRAFEELEKEGLLETIPAKGTFVARGSHPKIAEKRALRTEELLRQACAEARRAGISEKELQDLLSLFYKEEE